MTDSTAPPLDAPSIRCRGVSVTFPGGVSALDQVVLDVGEGEIVSLIGASGCGKTTLLRVIAGLQPATAGVVQLSGSSRNGETAFVFQQPSLLPWRTALENVTLPLNLIGGWSAAEKREAGRAMLATVGLEEAQQRLPHQLSGGMQMRVSIARALVTRPRVLLLDEPFAALDDMLRHQMGQLFLDLWQELQFTAVMVTHHIVESILLSHRIGVMGAGRLVDVIENPLPRPRDEALHRSAEFGEFYGQVSDALRGA